MKKALIRKKAQRLTMKALPFMLTLDVYAEGKDDSRIEEWAARKAVEQEDSADAFLELAELVEKHPWLEEDVKKWR